MAYFARQKRQSRFYWAELGFMALGLLGLQPSLFTNLLTGSASKLQAPAEAQYQTQLSQAMRGYEYMSAPQFASYSPFYPNVTNNPFYGKQTLASSLAPLTQQPFYNTPQPVYTMLQPYAAPTYFAPTHVAPQTYNTAQSYYGAAQPNFANIPPYSPSNYSQQSYSQPFLPASNSSSNYFAQQPLYNTPSSLYQQNEFQPAKPVYSNGSQNSAVSSSNWTASQPSLYAGNSNSYAPQVGNSRSYQNYATNLHDATAPRLTQNQMFANGVNANNYGPTSSQDYRNKPHLGGNSSFPSYRTPSPLYR